VELGLVAGAVGSLTSCGRSGGGPDWRSFTAGEARTVDAICEQIIPADEFAGASRAGVVHFIDLQLATHYRQHRDAYRKGIVNIEATAGKSFARPFVELTPEQQTEILRTIEETDARFFALIRTHTMQGYYGDPRHGGNRDEMSWRMLGLPTPPVRGRLPFKKTG
jgi:gluconate 2-dehydrogenase gamma chain